MKYKIAVAAALLSGQVAFSTAAYAISETDKCIAALWHAPVITAAQLDMSQDTMDEDTAIDEAANDEMAYTGDDIAYGGETEEANATSQTEAAPAVSRRKRGGHGKGKSKSGAKHSKRRLSSRPRTKTGAQTTESACCAPTAPGM